MGEMENIFQIPQMSRTKVNMKQEQFKFLLSNRHTSINLKKIKVVFVFAYRIFVS